MNEKWNGFPIPMFYSSISNVLNIYYEFLSHQVEDKERNH